MKDSDIIQLIQDQGTVTRAVIRAEIDRIDEMDHKRNGVINETKQKVIKLEAETRWTRWMGRNPKVAIIIFVTGVALVLMGFNALNVRRTAEKVLNIELKEKDNGFIR